MKKRLTRRGNLTLAMRNKTERKRVQTEKNLEGARPNGIATRKKRITELNQSKISNLKEWMLKKKGMIT
jgi:Flp pilus assembly protein CpaB